MKYKLISNIVEFKGLENDWKSLYENNKENTVFQSFEFNYFSWIYDLAKAKNTLTIVIAFDYDKIKAIFPFYIDINKQLRFINDIHADFCDCISLHEIDIEKIFQITKEQYQIRNIHLINLKANSIIKMYFENFKDDCLLLMLSEKYSEIQLEKGDFPDNYIKYRSKKKTGLRRIKKINIDKTHYLYSALSFTFPKKHIINLKEKMIALGYRKNNFLSDEQLMIIENLYIERKLFISVIRKNNKLHALSFILNNSSEYLFWIDMFDDTKLVNIFNYISLMQKLSSNDAVKMNLGRGVYNYKITNFNPEIKQLFAVYVFSNKFQKLGFLFFKNVKHMIKKIFKI